MSDDSKKTGGKEIEIQKDYSNYKLNEEGYLFPYTQSSIFGTLVMTKISENTKIEESKFQHIPN